MTTKLIKSTERVRSLGEVFTPDFLVERMLDQFPDDAWEQNKNWLEPTCGNGQFILGILRRKMSKGHNILKALNTTFGVDIMADNVSECRIRIYREIVVPYANEMGLDNRLWRQLRVESVCIVINNIRTTDDTLKEDFTKWKRFADRTTGQRNKIETKIKQILSLVDNNNKLGTNNKRDTALFKELSVLKRGIAT